MNCFRLDFCTESDINFSDTIEDYLKENGRSFSVRQVINKLCSFSRCADNGYAYTRLSVILRYGSSVFPSSYPHKEQIETGVRKRLNEIRSSQMSTKLPMSPPTSTTQPPPKPQRPLNDLERLTDNLSHKDEPRNPSIRLTNGHHNILQAARVKSPITTGRKSPNPTMPVRAEQVPQNHNPGLSQQREIEYLRYHWVMDSDRERQQNHLLRATVKALQDENRNLRLAQDDSKSSDKVVCTRSVLKCASYLTHG